MQSIDVEFTRYSPPRPEGLLIESEEAPRVKDEPRTDEEPEEPAEPELKKESEEPEQKPRVSTRKGKKTEKTRSTAEADQPQQWPRRQAAIQAEKRIKTQLAEDYKDYTTTEGTLNNLKCSTILAIKTLDSDTFTVTEVKDSPNWNEAIKKKLEMLENNKTWTIMLKPKDGKIIDCKFVLKQKRNATGGICKYKARLVVQGFSQIKEVDFQETFSPVTSITTIMLILSIATFRDWEIHQMDFDSAYLNTDLTEEIYMEIPDEHSASDKGNVFRLQKSLYGLKQAG